MHLEIIMSNSLLRLAEAVILKSLATIQTQDSNNISRTSSNQSREDLYRISMVAHPNPTRRDPTNLPTVSMAEEIPDLITTMLIQRIWGLS